VPGVLYATTLSGQELPILDVTHPAFQVAQSAEQLIAEAQAFQAQQARTGLFGRLFNRHILPRFLKRSIVGRGLMAAADTHLDGLTTYLLKLGPQALGHPAFNDLDRRISASIAGKLLRVRARDMAEAQARHLLPLLLQAPQRPLHLVNIAGGPSTDSLNCLRLLASDPAQPLAGREIRIHLLDLASEGPRFAQASLTAWMGAQGPLQGLDLRLDVKAYNWEQAASRYAELGQVPKGALLLVSSEGGLFDYAEDEVVLANLKAIRENAGDDAAVFGTINLPDGPGAAIRRGSLARLVPRTPATLQALAERGGWHVAESWERPTSVGFRLEWG
jgi:hypothetical protein